MREGNCWNCNAEKVKGRLNCKRCGRVYRDASSRRLERDPRRQGEEALGRP